jgi:uncharacterized protein (TIGR03083 family)
MTGSKSALAPGPVLESAQPNPSDEGLRPMTLADRTIAAHREIHDQLVDVVPSLTDSQLTARSGGAAEWSTAQVLSHLGSGAEISLATLKAALGEGSMPDGDFNQGVWDRWNAMAPRKQAEGFVEHDTKLLEAFEALSPDQREHLQITLSFSPAPFAVEGVAGMRLNEMALHGWDVLVGLDPTAHLKDGAADTLLDQLSGPLGFMLGFTGKADAVASPAVVDVHGHGLTIADGVSLSPTVENATATFNGPKEAAVRMFAGRLTPEHTPDSVSVEGNVALDDLRKVFPGY